MERQNEQNSDPEKRVKKLLNATRDVSADPRSIISSIRKLRFCLIDQDAVVQFRNDEGLAHVIVLLRRFLPRFSSCLSKTSKCVAESSLSASCSSSQDASTQGSQQQATGDNDLELADVVNEIANLLYHCCNLDNASKLAVKSSPLLQLLSRLLQMENLPGSIFSTILKLLVKLAEHSDCAASLVKMDVLINSIVHWMNRHSPTTENLQQKSNSVADFYSILNLFYSLSCVSPWTSRHLLAQNDLAYQVAKFLNSRDIFYCGSDPVAIKIILELLLRLSVSPDDLNFSDQFIRAQASEEVFKLATQVQEPSSDSGAMDGLKSAARNLLAACIRDHSDIRIDLSKFGIVEYLRDKILSSFQRPNALTISLLCKFSADGFTRAKLRSTNSLSLLLSCFRNLLLKNNKSQEKQQSWPNIIHELISTFTSYLYDEIGLEYVLKWKYSDHGVGKKDFGDENLLSILAQILHQYTKNNQCPFVHSPEIKDIDDEQFEKLKTDDYSWSSAEFRASKQPDSYLVKCPNPVNNFVEKLTGCLKDDSFSKYRNLTASSTVVNYSCISPGYCSPTNSNSRSSPSYSPGVCWSPGNSSLGARSPGSFSDTPMASDCFSDALSDDESFPLTNFDKSEWFSDLAFAKNVPKTDQADQLCECSKNTSAEQCLMMGSASDFSSSERSTNDVLFFLSFLSHSERFAEYLSGHRNVVEAVMTYVSQVCRPQPRAGRMLKRLARDRRLTEHLLGLQFHKLVRSCLCTYKCQSDPVCTHCRKLCRIGCDIMLSFKGQVDTDFGAGILAHKILNDSSHNVGLKYTFAIPYLIRLSSRRRKFLIEYNCLEKIVQQLLDDNDEMSSSAFYSLKELITLRRLKEMWSSAYRLRDDFSDTLCHVPRQVDDGNPRNTITFVSFDRRREILADKEILCKNSQFYFSMFSGSFSESSILRFDQSESGTLLEFKAFEIFLHLLHDCRLCRTVIEGLGGEKSTGDRVVGDELKAQNSSGKSTSGDSPDSNDDHLSFQLLSYCLQKADQHLRPDLYDYLVRYRLPQLIKRSNMSSLIWRAVLGENNPVLFNLCAVFYFYKCKPDDLFKSEKKVHRSKNLIGACSSSESFFEHSNSHMNTLKLMLIKFCSQFV